MYPKYKNTMPQIVDVSLRRMIDETIYGTQKERPRGTLVIIQNLIRDSMGRPITSEYAYKHSNEAPFINRGYATTRTGYICTEKIARILRQTALLRRLFQESLAEIGPMSSRANFVLLSYRDKIKEHDIIVIPKLDDEGNIINPVSIDRELFVITAFEKRLDNGRLEGTIAMVADS